MSDRDVLDEAFAALREETPRASDEEARATRQRVLLAAQAAKKKRRAIVVRLVLPLAAVLAIGTAWAAWTGRLSPEPQTERLAPTATTTAAPRATLTAPPPAIPSAAPSPSEALDGGGEPAAAATTTSSAPAPSAKPSPTSARARADDPEETRYRGAHDAHFVKQDPARALAEWDAYLAAYPSGRFAPEARYNRGICLVRLGRTREARDALRPFADAKPGSYRQHEAKQLLDALE